MISRRAALLLGAALALGGCAHEEIRVSALEVRRHVAELRREGEAVVVDRSGDERTIAASEQARGIEHGRGFFSLGLEERTLGRWIAGCPEEPYARVQGRGACPIAGLRSVEVERIDWEQTVFGWAAGTLTLSAVSGLVYCGAECEGPARDISLVTSAVLGVGVIVLIALIAAPFA